MGVFALASLIWDLPDQLRDLGPAVDDVVLLLAVSHLLMMVSGARRGADLKGESERRHDAEELLRHRARHDPLTGLLNRAGLAEELELALGDRARGGASVSVLLIDLDRFEEVNDTLGHAIGDTLLQAVAHRLGAQLREDSRLARLGGDEFVVVLRSAGPDAVGRVTDRLLAAIRAPFEAAGLVLEIDGSIGVASHGSTAEDLLRAADVAMYAAKADHAGVVLHSPALDRQAPEQLALFGELRRGIAEGQLVLHYQPKATVAHGQVLGVEALVRWQHPGAAC